MHIYIYILLRPSKTLVIFISVEYMHGSCTADTPLIQEPVQVLVSIY